MRTALVAIACNEDHYLREWFTYHHNIGFDDIYVYENNWHFKEEVPDYVHLIDFPGMCQQIPAYNDFISKFSEDYDWALFIDVDEFFVPNQFKDAKEALAHYKDYYGVAFNWKLFGSNGHDKADYSKGVIQRFTKSQKGLNQHIKTALNLKLADERLVINDVQHVIYINDVRFCNPHFVGIAARCYFTIRADMLAYAFGPFAKVDDWLADRYSMPYIAHYVTKSKEECVERRSRSRADTNAARGDFEGFWNEHNVNEVDNFDVVRFAGGPKKRDCCETNK